MKPEPVPCRRMRFSSQTNVTAKITSLSTAAGADRRPRDTSLFWAAFDADERGKYLILSFMLADRKDETAAAMKLQAEGWGQIELSGWMAIQCAGRDKCHLMAIWNSWSTHSHCGGQEISGLSSGSFSTSPRCGHLLMFRMFWARWSTASISFLGFRHFHIQTEKRPNRESSYWVVCLSGRRMHCERCQAFVWGNMLSDGRIWWGYLVTTFFHQGISWAGEDVWEADVDQDKRITLMH